MLTQSVYIEVTDFMSIMNLSLKSMKESKIFSQIILDCLSGVFR